MKDKAELPRILVISPVPPPFHGQTYAVQLLMEACGGKSAEFVHLDTRFAGDVAALQRFSLRKFALMVKYLFELVLLRFGRKIDAVLLTPSVYRGPLLKDAVFIWTCRILFFRRLTAWFHMDLGNLSYAESGGIWRLFVRATLKQFDHYVCVAPELVSAFPGFIDRRKISVISNGIPDHFADASEPEEPRKEITVLYLSNMNSEKGWLVLFEAADNLCAKFPGVNFTFHGSPSGDWTEDRIREKFDGAAPGARISWMGSVSGEEKNRAFLESDLFCFPSLTEAFPMTILEAMSAGLPIVASRVGGIPTALREGEGGFLIEPGDAKALEEALATLLEDPSRRVQMGEFNRRRYSGEFTVAAFARRWGEFFVQITQ